MLAGAVRVRRRFVDLRAIGVARLSVFVLYLRGRCEGYVFDCRRITYRAKPLCIKQSLSARRDGELVESPALQNVEFIQKVLLGGCGCRRVRIARVVVGNAIFVGRDSEEFPQLAFPRGRN
jgi:hypothetical protein